MQITDAQLATYKEQGFLIVPGGSVCLYSVFTRHAASDFTAPAGHRPVMWVGFTRKDRPWDGGRTFTYKSGAQDAAMNRFMAEATPRQRELLGFPPPGDPLWTEGFIAGMATRYPGFDAEPYYAARRAARRGPTSPLGRTTPPAGP